MDDGNERGYPGSGEHAIRAQALADQLKGSR
jgi:hypothetical protein